MPAGKPLSARQRAQLGQLLATAHEMSGLHFSLYVGALSGGRSEAVARHAGLPDPTRSVLVAVDPAARALEIVTGAAAAPALDQRTCALAAIAMTAAFEQGDLYGGLVRGLRLLGERGRRAPVLHLDEPA